MRDFLLDVNVLVALSLTTHQHHAAATRWFGQGVTWATTPMTEAAYLRLLTNPRVTGHEIGGAEVLAALGEMRAVPTHRFLADDSSLAEPHVDTSWLAGPSQVTDFHLLNLAAAHQLRLATFDASFARALAPGDRRHLHVLTD